MSTSKGYLKDARGVDIRPGDVVIYGFGVSRSVAMAEGIVLGKHENHTACLPPCQDEVMTTPTGLVKVRVVRRSYAQGSKPVISIMADRMVVLKPILDPGSPQTGKVHVLPDSPLPTQDEELYDKITASVERYLEDIERLESGGGLEEHERRDGNYPDYTYTDPHDPDRVASYLSTYREWESRDRRELERCCARLGREMPV